MDGPLPRGLSLRDVYRARARLDGLVHRTPLVPSATLTAFAGAPVWLKLENQQLTGSFKLRGAFNAVLALGPQERARGVVTVSTGNHGRAVAFACSRLGVPVTVCMSSLVPANKLRAVEDLGARVCVVGSSQDEAQLEADRLVEREGLTLVPPFDHEHVIAGQGTIGLEIVEQLAALGGAGPDAGTGDVDSAAGTSGAPSGGGARAEASASRPPSSLQVFVPLSGGGLVSGVALALKSIDPSIRVVGVSMERGCAMYHSLQAGEPVQVEELETLADSLGGGIGSENRYTFAMVRELVDDVVLLDEEAIAGGIVHAYEAERQVVEGAAAVGIAAIAAGAARPGVPAVAVVSGANIDMELHRRLVSGGMVVGEGAHA